MPGGGGGEERGGGQEGLRVQDASDSAGPAQRLASRAGKWGSAGAAVQGAGWRRASPEAGAPAHPTPPGVPCKPANEGHGPPPPPHPRSSTTLPCQGAARGSRPYLRSWGARVTLRERGRPLRRAASERRANTFSRFVPTRGACLSAAPPRRESSAPSVPPWPGHTRGLWPSSSRPGQLPRGPMPPGGQALVCKPTAPRTHPPLGPTEPGPHGEDGTKDGTTDGPRPPGSFAEPRGNQTPVVTKIRT